MWLWEVAVAAVAALTEVKVELQIRHTHSSFFLTSRRGKQQRNRLYVVK